MPAAAGSTSSAASCCSSVVVGDGDRSLSVTTLSTAAVTSDGRVFTWGDCDGGALGHGNRLCDVPTEVDLAVTTAAAPAEASAPADITALLARAETADAALGALAWRAYASVGVLTLGPSECVLCVRACVCVCVRVRVYVCACARARACVCV